MRTLTVNHSHGSYPVCIGSGLINDADLLQRVVQGTQVLLVTDTQIAPLYKTKVQTHLEKFTYSEIILTAGEQHKTPKQLLKIIDQLADQQQHRDTTLFALGGGVIGDITGFAAACYHRGVAFVQLPTSLLAQVDASVGGKTAVNLPQGKNLMGAFHQPKAVLIDIDTLNTLPERQFIAGLAEIIKIALVRDANFLAWLEENMLELLKKAPDTLIEAIYQACALKAEIIACDEREQNIRALLNLGHTFGHAIEKIQGYGQVLHGEAVSMGTVLAAQLSAELKYINNADVERIIHLLKLAKLPIEPPKIKPAEFINAMYGDKKILKNKLRLVLLKKIGQGFITDDLAHEDLVAFLNNTL
ncbi:MAG: 3-dehydroquinate synthase [Gammaproteobacteria bacterium]|nr:3-dehydroquinate synthase [Gammaproteobacteria bacterium]